jgi:hypothetical protein
MFKPSIEEAHKHATTRRLLREIFLRQWIFKISVLVIALGYGYLEFRRSEEKSALPFQISIIFALIMFLGEMVFAVIETQQQLEEQITSEAKGLQDKIKALGSAVEIREAIRNNRNAIGAVLQRLHDQAESQLKVNSQGFRIKDSHWFSLIAYTAFWDELINAQEKAKTSGMQLTAHVVHGTSIDLWLNLSFAKQLARQQRRFKAAGGMVKRIICGKGTSPTLTTAKEHSVAKEMANADVWVKYYDTDDGEYECDFIYVSEWNNSVVWSNVTQEGTIKESLYITSAVYGRINLKENWELLETNSKDFIGFKNGMKNEQFMETELS